MDAMRVAAAVAVLVAVALWAGARAVRRGPRSVAEARRSLSGISNSSPRGRTGESFVQTHLGENLSLAETTAAAVATRLLAAAAVMFFAVLAGVVALLGTGMLPASPVWLALPLVAALLDRKSVV